MLANILSRIKHIIASPSQQSDLDAFINCHQPTSIGDLEHWIKVYDRSEFNNRSSNFYNFHQRNN